MPRNALVELLTAGDGRRVSEEIVSLRRGEVLELVSEGWDCDEDGEIIVYKFLHYPTNPRCETPLIRMWTKDVNCDPLSTVEVPRVKLTLANAHDIIDEHGQYMLVRQRGAEDVTVYGKYGLRPE